MVFLTLQSADWFKLSTCVQLKAQYRKSYYAHQLVRIRIISALIICESLIHDQVIVQVHLSYLLHFLWGRKMNSAAIQQRHGKGLQIFAYLIFLKLSKFLQSGQHTKIAETPAIFISNFKVQQCAHCRTA
jgi:hypothetical protein